MGPTVALISLGCAKNLVDAEVTVGELLARGYVLGAAEEDADVVIVNTCAFIGPARDEAREVLTEVAARIKPGATLAVTGCLAQREGEALRREYPRVNVVVGVSAGDTLARVLEGEEPPVAVASPAPPLTAIGDRPRLTAPHVAYIKIADGCDHPCSFCVIPRLRGPFRSRTTDDVVREAETALANGAVELVLIAQDSSRYGWDLGGTATLAGLLRRLGATGAPWIRVLYLHPERLDAELVEAFAETPGVLPYFDIPLQHVAPHLLKTMGRPEVAPDQLIASLSSLRAASPGAAVRTAFIVGFPGETARDVNLLADVVQEVRFDHVGVFEFSAEEGTPAALLPGRLDARETAARREVVMFCQQEVLAARYRELEGARLDFLVDGVAGDGLAAARAYFQAPEQDPITVVAVEPGTAAGDFVSAVVCGHDGYDLIARADVPPGKRRA